MLEFLKNNFTVS